MGSRLRGALALPPAAAVVLAAVVACRDAPTPPGESAPGYDPRGVAVDDAGHERRFIYHWPVGATARVYVDPTAAPAGSDLRAAVVDGAALWTATLRDREVTVAIVTDPSGADVVVHYGEAPRIVEPGSCVPPSVGAAGVTFSCPDFAAGLFEVLPLRTGGPGQVKMDVAVYRDRAADEADFRRVVAHEMGHVLGIGAHSLATADLMYRVPAVDAPSAADAQTLRYVVHQPADVRP